MNWLKESLEHTPKLLLLVSLVLMFGSLRYIVKVLKSLVLARVSTVFDQVIFKNAGRAMVLGLGLTVLVQSSSITTSLAVPLAGAGILTLQQIFPYTLGANVGTTVTAMLAALATGEVAAVTVAFSHLLFNVIGIAVIWPFRAVRQVPMALALWLADLAVRARWIPILYIALAFYVLPLVMILLLR